MAAFNLALNTYFVVKRGPATGITMSITGSDVEHVHPCLERNTEVSVKTR